MDVSTIALFGGYDREAPRLLTLRAGLERLGCRLIDCQVPSLPVSRRYAVASEGLMEAAGRVMTAQLRLARHHRRLQEADVILVPYPGHLDMPLARRLARRYGKPLVFDPFLSLFDTAVSDRGLFSAGSMRGRACLALDRLALRLADRVLADTPAQADFYAALAGLPRERLAVVPVGADEARFAPRPPRDAGAPCTVLFYGSMIPLHGVETLIAAAKRLPAEAEVSLVLVGEGQLPAERWVREAGLGARLRWMAPVAYDALPDVIAAADLCLGIFGTSEKAGRVVPHKIYECAAMGQAILTADTPAIREAFGMESLCLVPAGDSAALAEAIADLAADPAQRAMLGDRALARYRSAYTAEAIARDFLEAIAPLRDRSIPCPR